MKLRIANIGFPAIHHTIVPVELQSSGSLSDYDALIFDPQFVVGSMTQDVGALQLRQGQVRELLEVKAGAVVTLVKPSVTAGYFLLDEEMWNGSLTASITPEIGFNFSLSRTASWAGRDYFYELQEEPWRFDGNFSADSLLSHGRTIATNSVGKVISAQFDVRNGKILFLPCTFGSNTQRTGFAVFRAVESLLKTVRPWTSSS